MVGTTVVTYMSPVCATGDTCNQYNMQRCLYLNGIGKLTFLLNDHKSSNFSVRW